MQQRLSRSQSPLLLVSLSCAFLLVLHQSVLLCTAYSGHDQAWYLFAAQRFLGGSALYGPYLADTNPPLIVWFSTVPVVLSRISHLSPILCLGLTVLVLLLASAAWCLRILGCAPATAPPSIRALIGLVILIADFRIDLRDFGQREHLFVIFALPYLFAVATNAVERLSLVERCTIGLAAGIAVCFKPQHALAFIAAELVLLIARRNLHRLASPELLTLIGTCGIYLLAVHILTPGYTAQIVPLLLDAYWAYGPFAALDLVLALKLYLLITFATIVLTLALFRFQRVALPVFVFVACSLASMVAYVVQHTGWAYHRYPQRAFLILAICILLVNFAQPLIQRLDLFKVRPNVVFACLAATFLVPFWLALPHPQRSEADLILRNFKPPQTVYIFSTNVYWMSDVLDRHFEWGSRGPCLWLLPSIIQNEQGPAAQERNFKRLSPERLAPLSSLQRTQTTEDLNRFQPSLILVERCNQDHPCQALEGRTFDMLPWFLESQDFAAVWSHYRRQPSSSSSFDLYTRVQ
ncbi:hypothetical protein [Edaphobacter aggregans]|uniref:hypothetical protein n=1 Tax=Edaphobacter aggregans TaxID=570835 RepID=UPI00054FB566|nr:hypothetical protein [Edaphobacter aggregans]